MTVTDRNDHREISKAIEYSSRRIEVLSTELIKFYKKLVDFKNTTIILQQQTRPMPPKLDSSSQKLIAQNSTLNAENMRLGEELRVSKSQTAGLVAKNNSLIQKIVENKGSNSDSLKQRVEHLEVENQGLVKQINQLSSQTSQRKSGTKRATLMPDFPTTSPLPTSMRTQVEVQKLSMSIFTATGNSIDSKKVSKLNYAKNLEYVKICIAFCVRQSILLNSQQEPEDLGNLLNALNVFCILCNSPIEEFLQECKNRNYERDSKLFCGELVLELEIRLEERENTIKTFEGRIKELEEVPIPPKKLRESLIEINRITEDKRKSALILADAIQSGSTTALNEELSTFYTDFDKLNNAYQEFATKLKRAASEDKVLRLPTKEGYSQTLSILELYSSLQRAESKENFAQTNTSVLSLHETDPTSVRGAVPLPISAGDRASTSSKFDDLLEMLNDTISFQTDLESEYLPKDASKPIKERNSQLEEDFKDYQTRILELNNQLSQSLDESEARISLKNVQILNLQEELAVATKNKPSETEDTNFRDSKLAAENTKLMNQLNTLARELTSAKDELAFVIKNPPADRSINGSNMENNLSRKYEELRNDFLELRTQNVGLETEKLELEKKINSLLTDTKSKSGSVLQKYNDLKVKYKRLQTELAKLRGVNPIDCVTPIDESLSDLPTNLRGPAQQSVRFSEDNVARNEIQEALMEKKNAQEQLRDIQQKFEELQTEKESLADRHRKLQQDLGNAGKEIERQTTLRNEITSNYSTKRLAYEETIRDNHTRIQELEEELKLLKKSLSASEETAAATRNAKGTTETAQVVNELENANKKIEDNDKEIKALKERISFFEKNNDDLAHLKVKLDQLKLELETSSKNELILIEKIAQLDHENEELIAKLNGQANNLHRYISDLEKLKAETEAKEAELQNAREKLTVVTQREVEFNEVNQKHERLSRDYNDILESSPKEIAAREAEITKLSSMLNDIQNEKHQASLDLEKLRIRWEAELNEAINAKKLAEDELETLKNDGKSTFRERKHASMALFEREKELDDKIDELTTNFEKEKQEINDRNAEIVKQIEKVRKEDMKEFYSELSKREKEFQDTFQKMLADAAEKDEQLVEALNLYEESQQNAVSANEKADQLQRELVIVSSSPKEDTQEISRLKNSLGERELELMELSNQVKVLQESLSQISEKSNTGGAAIELENNETISDYQKKIDLIEKEREELIKEHDEQLQKIKQENEDIIKSNQEQSHLINIAKETLNEKYEEMKTTFETQIKNLEMEINSKNKCIEQLSEELSREKTASIKSMDMQTTLQREYEEIKRQSPIEISEKNAEIEKLNAMLKALEDDRLKSVTELTNSWKEKLELALAAKQAAEDKVVYLEQNSYSNTRSREAAQTNLEKKEVLLNETISKMMAEFEKDKSEMLQNQKDIIQKLKESSSQDTNVLIGDMNRKEAEFRENLQQLLNDLSQRDNMIKEMAEKFSEEKEQVNKEAERSRQHSLELERELEEFKQTKEREIRANEIKLQEEWNRELEEVIRAKNQAEEDVKKLRRTESTEQEMAAAEYAWHEKEELLKKTIEKLMTDFEKEREFLIVSNTQAINTLSETHTADMTSLLGDISYKEREFQSEFQKMLDIAALKDVQILQLTQKYQEELEKEKIELQNLRNKSEIIEQEYELLKITSPKEIESRDSQIAKMNAMLESFEKDKIRTDELQEEWKYRLNEAIISKRKAEDDLDYARRESESQKELAKAFDELKEKERNLEATISKMVVEFDAEKELLKESTRKVEESRISEVNTLINDIKKREVEFKEIFDLIMKDAALKDANIRSIVKNATEPSENLTESGELESLKGIIKSKQDEYTRLKEQVDDRDEQIEFLKAQKVDWQSEIQKLTNELDLSKQEIKKESENTNKIKEDYKNKIQEIIQAHEQKIEETESNVINLLEKERNEMSIYEEQMIKKFTSEMQKLHDENEQISKQLETKKSRSISREVLTAKEGLNIEFHEKIKAIEEESIKNLWQEQQTHAIRVRELNEQIQKSAEKYDEKQLEIEEFKKKNNQLVELIEVMKQEKIALNEDSSKQSDLKEIESLKSKISEYESRFERIDEETAEKFSKIEKVNCTILSKKEQQVQNLEDKIENLKLEFAEQQTLISKELQETKELLEMQKKSGNTILMREIEEGRKGMLELLNEHQETVVEMHQLRTKNALEESEKVAELTEIINQLEKEKEEQVSELNGKVASVKAEIEAAMLKETDQMHKILDEQHMQETLNLNKKYSRQLSDIKKENEELVEQLKNQLNEKNEEVLKANNSINETKHKMKDIEEELKKTIEKNMNLTLMLAEADTKK